VQRLVYGESSKRALLRQYKKNALARSYEFSLTNVQCVKLFKADCFYCGVSPSSVFKMKQFYGDYRYNGLDRKDPLKGYTVDNVVSCCGKCNLKKLTMKFDEFIETIKRIYDHLGLSEL
jgi:hypothetical protein